MYKLTEQEKAYLEDSLSAIRHAVQSIRFRVYNQNRVEVIAEMSLGGELFDLVLPNNTSQFENVNRSGRYELKELGLFNKE